ncbi:Fur family transcriptional regulator [Cohnella suwonensis]|uniref:Fur family transcriptional regulator n=1 Tax=Cohnella suwonensis TaxID=696072 RepID=A0ABW0M330_9BACL
MRKHDQYQEAIRELVKHGLRVTMQRKSLIALILQSRRPLTAMELYQRMEQSFKGMSYGTVYLNIKLYKDLGFIEPTLVDEEVCYRTSFREASPPSDLFPKNNL